MQTSLDASGTPQTFWHAVDSALAHNPTLQRRAAALRVARENDTQNLSKLLPTVNIQASKTLDDRTRYHTTRTTTSNEPTQIGVLVTQPIFNYVNFLSRGQTIPHIDAAVADLDFARQELVVRTATLTANWLEAKEVYELSDRYTQVTTHHARIVALRFRAGESTETELHEAESRSAQAEASRANARNVMDKAAASFVEVVGKPPSLDLLLPEFAWQEPPQFETRLSEFVEERADIRAARARMEESQITTKMRRAEHAPSLRFTYSASHTWDTEMGGSSGPSKKEDMDSQTSMLLLDIPVFNGGSVVSRTREAQAEWEGRVSDVDRLRALAVREAQEARLDMANLQRSIQAQTKALQYSQKALDGLQEAFLAGTRTILDLLDAQYEVLTVQTNLVRSRYQHRLARLRLWAAVGWPLLPEQELTSVAASRVLALPNRDPNSDPNSGKVAAPPSSPAPVANVPTQPNTEQVSALMPDVTDALLMDLLPEPSATDERLSPPMDAPTQLIAEQTIAPTPYIVDPPVMTTLPAPSAPAKIPSLPMDAPTQPSADSTGKSMRYIADSPIMLTLPVSETVQESLSPPSVPPVIVPPVIVPPVIVEEIPVVNYNTQPMLPEAGSRPESLLTPLPTDVATTHGSLTQLQAGTEAMPKMGWGPYYVCVGTYPNETALRPMEQRLTEQGISSLLETTRTRDNRSILRMLVGPFANFTDLIQARKQIDTWTNSATGWVRNRKWSPTVRPQAELITAIELPVLNPSDLSDLSTATSSGPFFVDLPSKPAPSPAPQGPLYPHLSEPPFYIHVGTYSTETAREAALQQLATIRIPTFSGTREAGSQRDTLVSPEGILVHRLLAGPFESYEESLQAKYAIQKATGLLTGAADNPQWSPNQSCPNENLVQPETNASLDEQVITHTVIWQNKDR